MKADELIDILIKKPCYVIDFMPMRVMAEHNIDFFNEVEQFYLSEEQLKDLSKSFTSIILKTLCYFDFKITYNGKKISKDCKSVEKAVKNVVKKQKGNLTVILEKDETLIQISGGQLTIAVYTNNITVQNIMQAIALSERLFWWKVSA